MPAPASRCKGKVPAHSVSDMGWNEREENPYKSPCCNHVGSEYCAGRLLGSLGWGLCFANWLSLVAVFFLLLLPAGQHVPGEKVMGLWALIGVPLSSLFYACSQLLRRKGQRKRAQLLGHATVIGGWVLLMLFVGLAFLLAP